MTECRTGFYGKLPDKGDFVTRNMPPGMVESWDAWLGRALAASRERLGPAWLERYLACPIWRFALSPGLCGADAAMGVLMPSVDKVSRQFPLTLAAPAGRAAPATIAAMASDWFAGAEALALAALAEGFEFDLWTARVDALQAPEIPAGTEGGESAQICVALADGDRPEDGFPALLGCVLEHYVPTHSLWWTLGSEAVPPSLAFAPGLPAPESFAAMLSGEWHPAEWRLPATSHPSR